MRALLDAVSDGVVVLDTQRRIVFLNRRAHELLDVGDMNVAGSLCREVLDTTDCECNCPLTRLEQRGEQVRFVDMTYRGRAGREIAASSTFEVLRDERGSVVGSVEVFRDLRDVRRLEGQLYGRRGLGGLVGKSCAMRHVYELLERAAAGVMPVLVTGESGTGKEIVARSIHHHSGSETRPFVAVNCAAHGERSLQRELFGSGRRSGAPEGRLQSAIGGTLFLDEVDRLTQKSQRLLLSRLSEEARELRVIASTSRDIEGAVERGHFDRDLFHALNAFAIALPPLRDRAEDIPLLVEHFLTLRNQESRARTVDGLAPDAMDLLCGYEFPGNVRELEHAIEHAFTRCRGKRIRLDHLPPSLTARALGEVLPEEADQSDSVEILERDFMRKVCEENGWRLNAVAETLGLSRTTLWRKLRRLGIEKPRRA